MRIAAIFIQVFWSVKMWKETRTAAAAAAAETTMNMKKQKQKTRNYTDQNAQNRLNKNLCVCGFESASVCLRFHACVRSHAKFLFQWSLSEQSNEQHQQQ